MSRNYNYHRKQNLWGRSRYSSKGRDQLLVSLMLLFGGLAIGGIVFLMLTK